MWEKSYNWTEKYVIGFLLWLLADNRFMIGMLYGSFLTFMFMGNF